MTQSGNASRKRGLSSHSQPAATTRSTLRSKNHWAMSASRRSRAPGPRGPAAEQLGRDPFAGADLLWFSAVAGDRHHRGARELDQRVEQVRPLSQQHAEPDVAASEMTSRASAAVGGARPGRLHASTVAT